MNLADEKNPQKNDDLAERRISVSNPWKKLIGIYLYNTLYTARVSIRSLDGSGDSE